MDKQEALKIWDYELKGKDYAYDFAGRKIKKTDFNQKNSVGWVIGYLFPLELGGKDYDGNRVIMHHETLEEKGLNYPEFSILQKKYKVNHDDKEDYYYIEKLTNSDYDEGGLV